MQTCKLIIVTIVDGQETKILRFGRLETVNEAIFLQYKEENASVKLILEKNTAKIERIGDYSLHLSLIPTQVTQGSLGIGANEGDISVYTHQVQWNYRETEIEIDLHYQLLFGEEPQTMKLHIRAEKKGSIYEKNE